MHWPGYIDSGQIPSNITNRNQATGNLGPSILKALVNAGFQVTALTREGSNHAFPSNVTPVNVDYDSLDSLTNALKGQDAVISTLASAALGKQLKLVEAASKAGVKRFIPSEFGSNTFNEKASKLPSFGDKVAVQNALKREAAAGRMTWTTVVSGPLFDWGMMVGMLMSPKGKTINLYDGGERRFSTTTLASIGKATASVLQHPKETENRPVYIQSFAPTLKQLLALGKKATGPEGWKETYVSVDETVNGAWAELRKEHPDPSKFAMQFICAAIWGEGYEAHFPKLDNELLGIKEMSEAEVQDLIAELSK